MDVTEIIDWFRATEDDHDKVPQWIYQMTEMLVEHGVEVEIDRGKYRTFILSFSVGHAEFCLKATLSWIRFEDAPYIPDNLVAIGDSVMRPNPCFG